MNELIDKFLFELFDGLRDKTTVLFGEFIADAQALAAIFMLLYFGVESFKMMSGDKKLEIIPLLRPFALRRDASGSNKTIFLQYDCIPVFR